MLSDHRLAHSQTCDKAEVSLAVLAQCVSRSFSTALVLNKQQAVPAGSIVEQLAGNGQFGFESTHAKLLLLNTMFSY